MSLRPLIAALALFLAPGLSQAERADRDKPLHLEALRVSIDDANKVQILEGEVVLTKGTMVLRADRVVIIEDQYGFQKSTAFGGKNGLARFRQKREGVDEYVEGEAERIEYNTLNEVAELFHRAWFKSGEDTVKGDYIWYDAINEKYLVTAGENRDPKAPPQRVRAVIQPKKKEVPPPAEAPRSTNLELRGAAGLSNPPESRE
jgi:lipopolysaccharide export system protein LptA